MFFFTIGGPVVGISIRNRLVLPTSLEDLDMLLSNLFSSKEESLSLASCETCASFNIIDCLFESLYSGWNLDSVCIVGSLLGYFSCHPVMFPFWPMIYC